MPKSEKSNDESQRALVMKEVIEFAKALIGGAAEQVGGILSDQAAYWRYKNFLYIRDKVAEIHQNRKFQGNPIPLSPRYALHLIEKASMEDEPTPGYLAQYYFRLNH